MTPEEQSARIEELEELFAEQRRALVALLASIDERNVEEIKHAIHELLHYPGHPRDSDPTD